MRKTVDIRSVVADLKELDTTGVERVKEYIIGYLMGRWYPPEMLDADRAKRNDRHPTAYWQWTGAEYVCSVCGFRTSTPTIRCPICETDHAMPTKPEPTAVETYGDIRR